MRPGPTREEIQLAFRLAAQGWILASRDAAVRVAAPGNTPQPESDSSCGRQTPHASIRARVASPLQVYCRICSGRRGGRAVTQERAGRRDEDSNLRSELEGSAPGSRRSRTPVPRWREQGWGSGAGRARAKQVRATSRMTSPSRKHSRTLRPGAHAAQGDAGAKRRTESAGLAHWSAGAGGSRALIRIRTKDSRALNTARASLRERDSFSHLAKSREKRKEEGCRPAR